MRSNLKKAYLRFAAASALLLLVIWVFSSIAFVESAHTASISQRSSAPPPIDDPATVLPSVSTAGGRTRSDSKPGATPLQELPASNPDSKEREECSLLISGRDHLGSPLSYKLVALKRHPIVSSTHLNQSEFFFRPLDKLGQAEFKALPPGRWHIFNVTKYRSAMYEEVGMVDVAPNTEDRFSFQLRGWLTFSGAVRIAENDSVALSLRLIDPEGKIRFGMAVNGPEPRKFPIDAPNDDHPDNWKAHRPGGFEFSGLLPGHYKLEIILDIEERLKLFKEIDLVDTHVDIDYGRIPQSEWFKTVR